MNAKLKISKNSNDEEGLSFYDEDNNDLYFISIRHLFSIDENYSMNEKNYGDVLTQLIRLAKKPWINKSLLEDVMKFMLDCKKDIDTNIIADTFLVIRDINKINILFLEYSLINPIPEYFNNIDKTQWRKEFKKYIKNKI